MIGQLVQEYIRDLWDNKFCRGDANIDRQVDISDAVFLLQYLFKGGQTPWCEDAADANDDGSLDISDPIRTLLYLFSDNPNVDILVPGPVTIATDPTMDTLQCVFY